MKKLKELLKKLLSLFKKEKPASVEVLPELNEVVPHVEKAPETILPHITAPSTRVYINSGAPVPVDPQDNGTPVDHANRVLDVPGVWKDLYEGAINEYLLPDVKAGMKISLQTGNVYNLVYLQVLRGKIVIHEVELQPGTETRFTAPKDGDYVVRVHINKGQNKGSINHWRH